MRVAIRALACLLFVAAPLVADPEVATVQVLREGAGGGSGAVFRVEGRTSYVLTNKHVAPTAGRYKVRAAGKSHDAEWVATSEPSDLALLKVGATLDSLPLADHEPPPGAPVRVFGYGGFPKAGNVVGPFGARLPGTGDIWRLTFSPEPGDSGSPVVDADGRLVGLLWGTAGFNDRRTCAVRLHEIKAFVAGHVGEPKAGPREMPPERGK